VKHELADEAAVVTWMMWQEGLDKRHWPNEDSLLTVLGVYKFLKCLVRLNKEWRSTRSR
jgi:hypothetical protein